MGKFYEFINSKLNQLKEAQEKEKNNDYEAKEINYANKTFTNVCIVNKVISILNKQNGVAGAVINNAASIVYDYNNNKIPPVSFGKDGVIIPKNLDTVISIIDERLNDNQIKKIVDELAEYKLPEEVEHVKFLENDVNELENNTAELNLGEEELNEYKDFVEALKGYNDPRSEHYCKLNDLKAAGVAYIKHKLPNANDVLNVDTSRLGTTANNRISFIQNVLNTVEDLRRDPAMPEGEEPIIDNERENIVIEDANELDNDNLIDEIKEDININIENAKDDEEIEFK